ncbi:hypothetical protein [Phytoactinopolyspora mesophila]|uniref:Uncharacterized protein n=1 Tax=Phytoactinopolyspora mesophila TaxID=2650750 RepID=A0A7K3MB87_9ACTN|nr:hypothetical protein [Phytoactinopolyspora mesophila]NDL60581.1 hypothetical protein [Phytoactinopolyspora mesophila]
MSVEPKNTFDIREFARTATGSHRDRLDLVQFDVRPLGQSTLRSLRYMRDLERSTMRYLRTVLVTPTHKDARVTAFLTTWAFEKYWVADAVDAMLARHEFQPAQVSRQGANGVVAWRRFSDRIAPIRRSLVDNTLGEDVVAVHMAAGTLDELLCQAGYERLLSLDGHPELARFLGEVLVIKARHLEFFEAEAHDRLRGAPRAQRLAKVRLRRAGWPSSLDEDATPDAAFFFGHVLAPAPRLVDRIDRRIQTLPGLEQLALARASVAASTLPRTPASLSGTWRRLTQSAFRSRT